MKKLKEIIYGKDYKFSEDPGWKWLVLILLIGIGFIFQLFWILAILQLIYIFRINKKLNIIKEKKDD